MNYLLADTITKALRRLTNEEQKLAKTAAFDLPLNPAHPASSLTKSNGRKIPISPPAESSSTAASLSVAPSAACSFVL